jgi:hypothetical protein
LELNRRWKKATTPLHSNSVQELKISTPTPLQLQIKNVNSGVGVAHLWFKAREKNHSKSFKWLGMFESELRMDRTIRSYGSNEIFPRGKSGLLYFRSTKYRVAQRSTEKSQEVQEVRFFFLDFFSLGLMCFLLKLNKYCRATTTISFTLKFYVIPA